MDDNRDGAVEEAGEEPVKAIYAAYDVICPRAGASNGSGGIAVAPAAGSGAEQDRINKRTSF